MLTVTLLSNCIERQYVGIGRLLGTQAAARRSVLRQRRWSTVQGFGAVVAGGRRMPCALGL